MKKVENFNIKNMADLREAKLIARKQLVNSHEELENAFSGLPLQLLGGAIGLATGFFLNKKSTGVLSQIEAKIGKDFPFKNDLKGVALQIAAMGVTRIISRFFSKKSH